MSPPASPLSQDSTLEKVASKRQPFFNASTFFKFGNSRHSRGPSGSLTTPSTDGRSPEESGSEVLPLDSAGSQPSSSSAPNTGQEQVNGKEARGKAGSTVTQHKRAHPYGKPSVKDDSKRKDGGKQEGDGKQQDDSKQQDDGMQVDDGKQQDDGTQEDDGKQKADGPTLSKLQDKLTELLSRSSKVFSSAGHK